ncbi:MAG: hypothetical protein ABEI75_00610 [Halobaculum sp.]
MRASVVLAVTAVVAVAALPAGIGPAAADGFVSVTTTVTPEQPTPDESFTVTATVTSAADSTESYRVTDVVLRDGRSESSDTVGQTETSSQLDPGETVSVAVDGSLDESGTRTLYLHLTLLDESGTRRTVIQPVTVEVRQPHPQVGVTAESAAPGEARPLTVTVSNGFDRPITNVEVSLAGDDLDVANDRRVTATVASGADRLFEFTVTPENESRLPVTVTLSYTVDGERRTVERTLTADFSSSDRTSEQPQLAVSVERAVPGAERSVNVTLANGLDESIRQVQVTVESQRVAFGESERVLAGVPAGESRTFRFPATVTEAGQYPITVTLAYTDDGVRKRVTKTVTADFSGPETPGTVTLTSVRAVLSDGTLRIDATASNPGTTDVGGVTVAVAGSDAVGSAEFFVGEIAASDFQPFTLRVPVSGRVSSVPVTVSYVVDGVRRSFTTELTVAVARTPAPAAEGGGGAPLVPVVGAAVVVALIVAAVVVRRR